MRVHEVRVHPSAARLPREAQLTWKLAELAAAAPPPEAAVAAMVACRTGDMTSWKAFVPGYAGKLAEDGAFHHEHSYAYARAHRPATIDLWRRQREEGRWERPPWPGMAHQRPIASPRD